MLTGTQYNSSHRSKELVMILIYSVGGRLHVSIRTHTLEAAGFELFSGMYHFEPCKTIAVKINSHVVRVRHLHVVPEFLRVVRGQGVMIWQGSTWKKCGTLHDFACHPCAGAMLIFSVSFQF